MFSNKEMIKGIMVYLLDEIFYIFYKGINELLMICEVVCKFFIINEILNKKSRV